MQSLLLHRPCAGLRAVAWAAVCKFSSRARSHSANSTIRDDEKGNVAMGIHVDVDPSAACESSPPNQHLIQFQLSSIFSTRLDVAIVSHFRTPDTSKSESSQLPTSAHRRATASAAREAALSVAVPSKVRPPRGREGRQQHSASALQASPSPPPSSFTLPKNNVESSRRKLYELRRAERQRATEAALSPDAARDSHINGATVQDVAVDEDEECMQPSLASVTPITVNCSDFEYHMNVTASLASRERVSQLIENGMVSLNGSRVLSKSLVLAAGSHSLSVALPFGAQGHTPQANNCSACPFPVLYEDDTILVICKPPGILVHPASSVHDATTPSVVSRLLEHGFSLPASQSAVHRAGLVHRLDRDTSGCLLIAKTHLALASLSKQFAERSVTKRYLAVVHGCPGHVVLRQRIASSQHSGSDRRARVAVPADSCSGKAAVTAVSTLCSTRALSVVEVLIGTGRTHQIRVHLSSVGCPVLGDTLYGGSCSTQDEEPLLTAITASRPMLHAHTLVFKHPITLKDITVTAPPPEDLLSLLRILAPSMWPPSLLQSCV